LRRIVSGYEDLVKAGVRLKTQRYSLLRVCGKNGYEKKNIKLGSRSEQFVLEGLERQIAAYEEEKESYAKEFKRLSQKYPEIRYQKSLPGIGNIHALKIVARVVTPYRFADKGHYLSYAGLIKLEKVSGGRSYGKKKSRYSRQLKGVYKQAVMAAIGGKNTINDYYEYLIIEKGYPPYHARNKACRRLATLSFGILKSRKKYQPHRRDSIRIN
jgi:transposase